MRLLTWNINSARLRLPLLAQIVTDLMPDMICLQEIKGEDHVFPALDVAALGYIHQSLWGMKSYNGVAILSRIPFTPLKRISWCQKDDARHVGVQLGNGVEVHNFYVPAGGDIPDPAQNEKFAHKLQFLDEMQTWSLAGKSQKRIVVGDLNIAPLEHDVWSHKQLLDVVSHTPLEVEKYLAVQQAGAYIDALRHLQPEPKKLYSWWSYRAADWQASNRGRRLDHIWLQEGLLPQLKGGDIYTNPRSWEKASDHTPVWVDLDL